MIDKLLAAATVKAIEEIMTGAGVPYEVKDDEEKELFYGIWDDADPADRDLAFKQAKPAMERILSKEGYAYRAKGEPLVIRFNYLNRKLERDSFGEILLERPDIDWHIAISVKNDANVLSSMFLADRVRDVNNGRVINVFNEIDDFGERIFNTPCTNEYFKDVNDILLTFEPYSTEEWTEKIKDEEFLYGRLITPMLKAMGAEIKRICNRNPEAPRQLIEFFYGKYDYYFIKPIDELQVTRIGAVNPHGDLGRIPHSYNHDTHKVDFPSELLELRFASEAHSAISRDTLQFNFDKGWSLCLKLYMDESHIDDRNFLTKVYMPVTPFGSYRDQVPWEK